MRSDYVNKRLQTIMDVSRNGQRVKDLYRLLYEKDLWLQAYANIAPNKGAMTKGPDDVTQDGFSEGRIENMILMLKEGTIHSKPARRVYIPKANGKIRPLGIPAGDDKLLQEVGRLLLERVYEPIFSEDSHGFRPERSCHTALMHLRRCTGSSWFIEFDIKGYFDNISHKKLVSVLEKKIDDKRFIGLIKSMLRAGYLEEWKFNRTFSGTPQGGVISPILANIYLHELDIFIKDMQREINVKKDRDRTPEADSVKNAVAYQRRLLNQLKERGDWGSPEKEERLKLIKTLQAKNRLIPGADPYDKHYRRLWYCRYADDFVLPFIGPKSEAIGIKNRIEKFLNKELLLEVSPEKTNICHASDSGVIFLGYKISVCRSNLTAKRVINGVRTPMKTLNGNVQLRVPADKGSEFCNKKNYGTISDAGMKPRPYLVNYSEVEIISLYNAELRGLANYYSMATDVKYRLGGLSYIATYSCLATLAFKHKSSIMAMAKRMKIGTDFIWKYTDSKGRAKSIRIWQIKHLAKKTEWKADIDVTTNPYKFGSKTELSARLNADQCEYCEIENGYFEVHHIKKLKDLKDKKHLEPWERVMIQRIRKTLVLCNECHDRLHAGTLPDLRLQK